MKVLYLPSSYISHLKAALGYIECLRLIGADLIDNLEQAETAEVVILHNEPPTYPRYFEKLPLLKRKYVIGYVVWETDLLPQIYREGMKLVNEIWTPSEYIYQTCKKYFDAVYKIPHVVLDPTVSERATQTIKEKIHYNPENYYFYSILKANDPRKNVHALVYAFTKLFPALNQKVYWVVKQYTKPLPHLSHIPHIISLETQLSDEEINALHAVCNCLVSTHCSEGWGLSLSDAMSYGNPVIATGYSGNMEYMTSENSFPLKYTLKNIEQEDLMLIPHLLNQEMKWAYVDLDDLKEKMKLVARERKFETLQENAKKIAEQYSIEKIASLIQARLTAISNRI